MPTLYKVLGIDGRSRNGGNMQWHLPVARQPGKWMPNIEGEIIPCQNGYHVVIGSQLLGWLGPRIFEVEVRGDQVKRDDKIVVREARLIRETGWNEKTARLFACDCAEHILPLYESKYPNDSRVRNCIETARKVANGDLPASELSAARTAAWAAAWAAAKAVAWDAARAAACHAAWDAARAAARDAARAAAKAASWAAAWDAEKKWQTRRLLKYLKD